MCVSVWGRVGGWADEVLPAKTKCQLDESPTILHILGTVSILRTGLSVS